MKSENENKKERSNSKEIIRNIISFIVGCYLGAELYLSIAKNPSEGNVIFLFLIFCSCLVSLIASKKLMLVLSIIPVVSFNITMTVYIFLSFPKFDWLKGFYNGEYFYLLKTQALYLFIGYCLAYFLRVCFNYPQPKNLMIEHYKITNLNN